MPRTLLALISVFAGVLLIVGLTFSATTDRPAEFRFINGSEPKTVDPNLATGEPEGRLLSALFEGLTRRDAKTMKPVPGIAESWDISDDGLTYRFHLRQAAQWTDGTPVTAHDFVYSWKRLLNPELGSEYSYILYPVRGAEALHAFVAHADIIKTELLPALEKLRAAPIPGPRWQKLLAETHAAAALRHADDPFVLELATRRDRAIEVNETSTLLVRLATVESKLRESAARARAHFGVDRGMYAPSERELVVELAAPTPYFLELTTFYPTSPVPRQVIERPGRAQDWFLPEHIVSNGPFAMKSWMVNDRIRLERNERYWGRADVHLASVDALSLENTTTSLNLYLTGEVDWLPKQYPTDLVDQLKTRPDFYGAPGMVVYFYRFNNKRPPLTDRRVRLALNLAIDRTVIVDDVLGLGQIPAYTFVPPGMSGYEAPESRIRFDPKRARALLSDAGYPDGKGFPELGILYNTYDTHKQIAEVIADQLRRNLGIRISAYNQEWQSYQATTQAMDYDLARAGWVGDYADPNTFLDMWVTNGGNNSTGFSSTRYDRLIRYAGDPSALAGEDDRFLTELREPAAIRARLTAVRTATSPKARRDALARVRMQLFKEAEAILVQDEFPILPIYFYVNSGLVRPHVHGFYSTLQFEDGSTAPNLQDLHPLRSIRVDTEARPR